MIESLGGRTAVSSSKVTAILGKNHFRGILEQFYMDTKKVKASFGEVSKQKMRMGHLIEPIIKEAVENHLGVKLLVDKRRYRHDDHEDFTVEFDAVDKKNKVIYEFKNTEMDEDHLLEYYYAQVQFAMYIIGWDKAIIAYLRNGWELGFIEIDRDEDFIEKAIPLLRYYADCVRDKTEPDVDYIMDKVDEIAFFAKTDEGLAGVGETADLTEDEVEMLYEWADVKLEEKRVKAENDKFKEYFGTKFGSYKDPSITYSNTEYIRKGTFDSKLFMKDNPDFDPTPYMNEDKVFQRQGLRLKKAFTNAKNKENVEKVTKDIV